MKTVRWPHEQLEMPSPPSWRATLWLYPGGNRGNIRLGRYVNIAAARAVSLQLNHGLNDLFGRPKPGVGPWPVYFVTKKLPGGHE
jgi:hypothetical protein